MPNNMKKVIFKYMQNGVKTKDIVRCMEENHGPRFHYDTSNVQNFLRNNTEKTVSKTVGVGDLIA